MGLFSNLTTDGLEDVKDTLGGGSKRISTGTYLSTIKNAYVTTAKSGAMAVNFVFDVDGRDLRETIYVTNKDGNNFYVNQNNKKVPLPGFNTVNTICMLTVEKELSQIATENKVISIYSFTEKKDVPTEVPVLVDLLGKQLILAVAHVKKNKQAKNDAGMWVDTAEVIELNEISHVFHTSGVSLSEAKAKEPATFMKKWEELYSGKVIDKTKQVAGGSPSAPATDTASAEKVKNSLFS